MKYEQAAYSNQNAIKELLESYGLPAGDFKNHLGNFIVAKESNEIIGVGGYETCEEYALLRSFAVKASHNDLGVAERIFKLVEAKAINLGVKRFYLLSDTAVKYFERFEFYECSRDNAPESIKKTKQYSELCPDTATLMCKILCEYNQ